MDLFRVDRYMGDDDEDGSPDKEESRLKQLYMEIERRKRKLEGGKTSGSDTHAQTVNEGRKKTKKARKQTKTGTEDSPVGDVKVNVKSRQGKQSSDDMGDNASETIPASSTDETEGVKESRKQEPGKAKGTNSKQKRKGSPTDKSKRTDVRKSKEPEKLESPNNQRQKKPDKLKLEDSTSNVTCEGVEGEIQPACKKQNGADADEQGHTSEGKEEMILNSAGYTVIGGHKKEQQVKKVQHMLPEWLANPTVVDADLSGDLLPVDQLTCLNKQLITKLQQQSMTHFFPVQSAVIPAVLSHSMSAYQPRDLCVSAPTGSGKTLAYVLPIVHSVMGRVVCHLRALVLLPTKDLANQVRQVFDVFTQGTGLKVGLASGTKSFAKEQEMIAGQK